MANDVKEKPRKSATKMTVKRDDNDDKKPKMRSMPRRDPKLKLGTRPMMPKKSMTPRTNTMMPGEADGGQKLKKRSK